MAVEPKRVSFVVMGLFLRLLVEAGVCSVCCYYFYGAASRIYQPKFGSGPICEQILVPHCGLAVSRLFYVFWAV